MDAGSTRWKAVTQTQYPWEREALDFVRERLPDHDPYLAWANFEFVAEDGSVNEVDLLVLTPKGFFLVEIKSRPGTVTGDLQNWVWKNPDGVWTADNPFLLANRKAKRLKSLLQRQLGTRHPLWAGPGGITCNRHRRWPPTSWSASRRTAGARIG